MNVERNRVLIIETANIRLKELVNNAMLFSYKRLATKHEAKIIIDECIKELRELDKDDKEFLNTVEIALKRNFLKWYQQMILVLYNFAKKDKIGLVRRTLMEMDADKDAPIKLKFSDRETNAILIDEIAPGISGVEQEEITNLRELMTIYDEGAAGTYVNYVEEVKNNIIKIESEIANGNLTIEDSLGRHKSIRNMAEIKTRYDLIQGDLEKLENKGVKYVVATAHANCSERCSHWQGKTFIVDLDINSRQMYGYDKALVKSKCKPLPKSMWVDGRPTYSLKAAVECGFLSYNCQHRVVAYQKGIQPPKYDAIQVEKRRSISTTQRNYENTIRHLKTMESLAATKKERKDFSRKWHKLEKEYKLFSEKNNAPFYIWRTQISKVEKTFKV